MISLKQGYIPGFSKALHWNFFFLKLTISREFYFIFKQCHLRTPRVGYQSQGWKDLKQGTLPLCSQQPTQPSLAQVHFLVLISGACGRAMRLIMLRLPACYETEKHITGCFPVSLASHPLPITSTMFPAVLYFWPLSFFAAHSECIGHSEYVIVGPFEQVHAYSFGRKAIVSSVLDFMWCLLSFFPSSLKYS